MWRHQIALGSAAQPSVVALYTHYAALASSYVTQSIAAVDGDELPISHFSGAPNSGVLEVVDSLRNSGHTILRGPVLDRRTRVRIHATERGDALMSHLKIAAVVTPALLSSFASCQPYIVRGLLLHEAGLLAAFGRDQTLEWDDVTRDDVARALNGEVWDPANRDYWIPVP